MSRHAAPDTDAPVQRTGALSRFRLRKPTKVEVLLGGLLVLFTGGGIAYGAATTAYTHQCVMTAKANGGTILDCDPTPSESPAPSPSPTLSPSPSPSATPSPTVAPTTSTAPPSPTPPPTSGPPSLLKNCFTQLAACGYPTLQGTGVAAGVALTPFTGTLFARTAGQVIQNLDISGCISVNAPGVVITNTRVRVPDGSCLDGIRTYEAQGGTTTITQVEVVCSSAHGSALAGPRFKALRVQLRGCENGSEINEGSSIIDSWIEGSEVGNDNAHGDDIQSQGGNNVVIRHNTFAGIKDLTASIITNPTKNNNWLVEDNFLSSGAYTLYCPEQGTNFVVRNNRFYPAKLPNDPRSAAFGLTDACSHSGIIWSGNYLDSTLAPVNP